MRNRLGNVAFTGAGVADQKRIGGILHKLTADQLKNLLSGEAGIIRPVKILHNFKLIQPGAVKTPLNQARVPAVQFILDKLRQDIQNRSLLRFAALADIGPAESGPCRAIAAPGVVFQPLQLFS
jgi:hypothetical protein